MTKDQTQPWIQGLTPSPIYSCPAPSLPAFGWEPALGPPPSWVEVVRGRPHDDLADDRDLAALQSLMVLPHNRQTLLYSQEVEGDYGPCEEDLFVL